MGISFELPGLTWLQGSTGNGKPKMEAATLSGKWQHKWSWGVGEEGYVPGFHVGRENQGMGARNGKYM